MMYVHNSPLRTMLSISNDSHPKTAGKLSDTVTMPQLILSMKIKADNTNSS